jgi:hypothetical protein
MAFPLADNSYSDPPSDAVVPIVIDFAHDIAASQASQGKRLIDTSCDRNHLLKIRPDLGVFLVADSVYLFQVVGAAKRPCGNDSSSHNRPNTRNHF